jgi:signal transduction histidine kinase
LTQKEAAQLRLIAGGAIFSFLCLLTFLILLLLRQVLDPIRTLALETGGNQVESSKDEVKSLSSSLRTFMEDFDYTHLELTKSREHLEQAEKMALVGKLAAGVAHSIRNPFTSVKMRLFSLNRGLDLSENQKEDFEVISEEIGRIDNIVQNFLEFARPPKLRMQECHVDDVIANVLQLLKHRLHAYNIEVNDTPQDSFPLIYADPEQLKEVLINLIINSCEAIGDNGLIDISREVSHQRDFGQALVIRIQDNGPGVPEALQDKIFQPFFTTKEEGTGLGLSMVSRIIEAHQGQLRFYSKEGSGTTFEILLPVKE